jgi:hypothetical protein
MGVNAHLCPLARPTSGPPAGVNGAAARRRAASFDATAQAHHALLQALQRSSAPSRAPYRLRRSHEGTGRAPERWGGLREAWSCGTPRGVADLPGPDSWRIAGRKRALAHFLDRRPALLPSAVERWLSRGEQRSHGRQPRGRDVHHGLLRSSASVCSDEPAHCQPSTCASYLGWTTSELLGELADPRVAVVDESKQQSHLRRGMLTALKHAEHPVECGVRAGHRGVAGQTLLLRLQRCGGAACPLDHEPSLGGGGRCGNGYQRASRRAPKRISDASDPCMSAKAGMVVSPYRSKRLARSAWVHATQPLP